MSNQETPARGQRGILISGFGGGVYFRQYAEDHSFVDYEVTNYDVEIEILDPHAALIRNAVSYTHLTLPTKRIV